MVSKAMISGIPDYNEAFSISEENSLCLNLMYGLANQLVLV